MATPRRLTNSKNIETHDVQLRLPLNRLKAPFMSGNNDLTNSDYWEKVWKSPFVTTGAQTRLQTISQWKFDRIVKLMLDTIRPNGTVLELGSAPGLVLQRMHRLRPDLQLSGIDFAEEGCRTASAMLQQQKISARIHYGDVRTTSLTERFDLVTSFGLVEHFNDPVEIIRAHARFSEPGGIVAFTLPNYTPPMVRFFAERFCPDNLAIHNLKTMNAHFLRAAMQDAGLKNVRVGGDGGNRLHDLISRQDYLSQAYAIAARLWNVGAILVPPQLGWHSNLWAIGHV